MEYSATILRVKQVRVSDLGRQDRGLAGEQQHVVKGKTFGNWTVDHSILFREKCA